MPFRRATKLLPAILLVVAGCDKSPDRTSVSAPPEARHPDTVFHIYWAGKRNLTLDGSAFYFNRLWNLPESQALESHVLDKLALAPWTYGRRGDPAKAPVALLRWILEALKHEEVILEARKTSDSALDWTLAVRVPDKDAPTWQNNLAYVLNSLTGTAPLSLPNQKQGWSLVQTSPPLQLELVRERGWSVFSSGSGPTRTSVQQTIARIQNVSASRRWLSVFVNLELARQWIPTSALPAALTAFEVSLTGDGGNVLTTGSLHLRDPMSALEPWRVPAELIRGELTSFAAARNLRHFIPEAPLPESLRGKLDLTQLYSWTTAQNPFQIYAAAPQTDANSAIESIATFATNVANPWLQENGPRLSDSGIPLFQKLETGNGIRWNIPQLLPFIASARTSADGFLLLGVTAQPAMPPAALPFSPAAMTNVIFTHDENTALRVEAWLPVLQTSRLLAHRTALPEGGPAWNWLNSIRSRLGPAETLVHLAEPNRLDFRRKSTLGLTAIELHLLADWIESATFPIGLHSFRIALK